MEAIHPLHTAATRTKDEVELFANEARPLSDAELKQYARRTTKRPLLCFVVIASLPFIAELVCRALGAW